MNSVRCDLKAMYSGDVSIRSGAARSGRYWTIPVVGRQPDGSSVPSGVSS
ncbi:hypothetical protein ACFWPQ_33820 [Streptomyces sp. NPDC058464]